MSDVVTDTIDYLTLILIAIRENRITAKELLDMTPEQRDAYKERLVAEEKSEIDRGKKLLEESEV